MSRIDLQDTEYLGTTSRPVSSLAIPSCCARCGSSLGGRKQSSVWATVGRARYVIHTWACGCGKRTIRRQEVSR